MFKLLFLIILFNSLGGSAYAEADLIRIEKIKGSIFSYLSTYGLRHRLSKSSIVELNSVIQVPSNSFLKLTIEKTNIYIKENSRFYFTKTPYFKKLKLILIKGSVVIKSKNLFPIQLKGDNEHLYAGIFYKMSFDGESYYLSKFKDTKFIVRTLNDNSKLKSSMKNSSKSFSNFVVDELLNNKINPLKDQSDDEFSSEFSDSTDDTFIEEDVVSDTKNDYTKFFKEKEISKSNMDFSYLIDSFYYFNPPATVDIDQKSLHFDIQLNLKSHIKGFGGKLVYSTYLQASNRKDIYNNIFNFQNLRDDRRSYLNLNELYFLSSGKNFDFTVGKVVTKFGKGMIHSPSGKFSPSDQMTVFSSNDIGSTLLEFDFYFGNSSIGLYFIPYLLPSRTPTQASRWSQQIDGSNYTLVSDFPNGKFYDLSKLQMILSYKTTVIGTDFEFNFFNGPNNDPIVKKVISVKGGTPTFTLNKEYPLVTNLSLGFSTTIGKFEFHGESLIQFAEKGLDDSYTSSMLGFRYTMDDWAKIIFSDSVTFITEFVNETILTKQSVPFYVASSELSRIYQKSLLGTINFKFNDSVHASFDYHFDFKNNGSAKIFTVGKRFKNDINGSLSIGLLDGDPTSLMGVWGQNDFASLTMTKSF